MSVLLPWERKKNVPESPSLGKDRPDIHKRSPVNPRRYLAGTVMAMILIVSVLIFRHLGPSWGYSPNTAWKLDSGKVLYSCGGTFLLQSSGGISVWNQSGRVFGLQGPVGDAVLGEDFLVYEQSKTLLTCHLDGAQARIGPVLQGEKLLPFPGKNVVYLYRPGRSLGFGEPWVIRAISLEGKTLWQTEVPLAPFMVKQGKMSLAIAATDILGGGSQWLLCMDPITGSVISKRRIGQGSWRNLLPTDGDVIVVVLDALIQAISITGEVVWTYFPDGILTSAVLHGDSIIISVLRDYPEALWRMFPRCQVTSISLTGEVRWSTSLSGKEIRLFPGSGDSVIALSENRVISLSVKNGRQLLRLGTKGYPISCSGELVLCERGGGLYLINLAEFQPGRETRDGS